MSASGVDYEIPQSVNADFGEPVTLDSSALPWFASPQAGVERRLLDRVGGEVARATSIVRYASDSAFPAHEHGAGEEFLVLEGTFCDENGDYGKGTYVRNPPDSRHAPFTKEGCVIFVKLRQMRLDDKQHVVSDTTTMDWQAGDMPRHFVKHLFANDYESVAIERFEAGVSRSYRSTGGEEILVLSGSIDDGKQECRSGAWLRYPPGYEWTLTSRREAEIWVKRGHLST